MFLCHLEGEEEIFFYCHKISPEIVASSARQEYAWAMVLQLGSHARHIFGASAVSKLNHMMIGAWTGLACDLRLESLLAG